MGRLALLVPVVFYLLQQASCEAVAEETVAKTPRTFTLDEEKIIVQFMDYYRVLPQKLRMLQATFTLLRTNETTVEKTLSSFAIKPSDLVIKPNHLADLVEEAWRRLQNLVEYYTNQLVNSRLNDSTTDGQYKIVSEVHDQLSKGSITLEKAIEFLNIHIPASIEADKKQIQEALNNAVNQLRAAVKGTNQIVEQIVQNSANKSEGYQNELSRGANAIENGTSTPEQVFTQLNVSVPNDLKPLNNATAIEVLRGAAKELKKIATVNELARQIVENRLANSLNGHYEAVINIRDRLRNGTISVEQAIDYLKLKIPAGTSVDKDTLNRAIDQAVAEIEELLRIARAVKEQIAQNGKGKAPDEYEKEIRNHTAALEGGSAKVPEVLHSLNVSVPGSKTLPPSVLLEVLKVYSGELNREANQPIPRGQLIDNENIILQLMNFQQDNLEATLKLFKQTAENLRSGKNTSAAILAQFRVEPKGIVISQTHLADLLDLAAQRLKQLPHQLAKQIIENQKTSSAENYKEFVELIRDRLKNGSTSAQQATISLRLLIPPGLVVGREVLELAIEEAIANLDVEPVTPTSAGGPSPTTAAPPCLDGKLFSPDFVGDYSHYTYKVVPDQPYKNGVYEFYTDTSFQNTDAPNELGYTHYNVTLILDDKVHTSGNLTYTASITNGGKRLVFKNLNRAMIYQIDVSNEFYPHCVLDSKILSVRNGTIQQQHGIYVRKTKRCRELYLLR